MSLLFLAIGIGIGISPVFTRIGAAAPPSANILNDESSNALTDESGNNLFDES